MPEILLIQPPIRDFYLTQKRTIPYSLSLMASLLEQHDFSVGIVDGLAVSKSRIIPWPKEMDYLIPYYGKPDITPFALFHHYRHFGYSFDTIAAAARDSRASIIGISSLFTPYHHEALKTAEVIKKVCPQALIVLGGHHPTAMPEQVLDCSAVDLIIQGEGEIPMLSLALARRAGNSWTEIPGIGFRRPTGELQLNPPLPPPAIDHIPLPAFHLIKSKYYQRNKRQSIVITAARGCPLKCSYCCIGTSGPPYRQRSVASVLNEIETALDLFDVGFIDFEDEHLSLNKSWLLSFLNQFTRRLGHLNIELRAMNGLFPPSLDRDIIQAMKQAGFSSLNLAIGSLDKQQLIRFNRPDMKQAVSLAAQIAAEAAMEIVAYLIIGAPDQSAEQSLRDMLWLSDKHLLVGASVFYPAPGSPDFHKCRHQGYLPPSLSLYRSSAIPIASADRTSTVTLLRLGRILNFIKYLRDQEKIRPHAQSPAPDTDHRTKIGIQALTAIYNKGKILGYHPETGFYPHLVNQSLVDLFLLQRQATNSSGFPFLYHQRV